MDLIYHYTTVDALIGMTANMSNANKNLTMWATDIKCMNDPNEREIGVGLIDSLLEKMEDELRIPVDRRISVLRSTEEDYKDALRKVKVDTSLLSYNVYVTSFSKDSDSLPMWSMYSKNGNGISLGFDFESVHRTFSKEPFFFGEIIYDNIPVERMGLLLKFSYSLSYEIMENFAQRNFKMLDNGLKNKVISLSTYRIYTLIVASLIKHHSYEYEKECRVCCLMNGPMRFRSSNGFIVPYIEYKIPIDFLRKIIIGPTLDYDRIINPLLKLFHSRGIDMSKIEIEKSKVPYRG